MGKFEKRYRVKPGERVRLDRLDPHDRQGLPDDRDEAKAEQAALVDRLASLQEALYAEHARAVLLVLQAMDTGGKDGTVTCW
jgi:polyphosphate kinase 2 (PPK2 family)